MGIDGHPDHVAITIEKKSSHPVPWRLHCLSHVALEEKLFSIYTDSKKFLYMKNCLL